MVADARASTPTKAGVVAVPDLQEILGQLTSMERISTKPETLQALLRTMHVRSSASGMEIAQASLSSDLLEKGNSLTRRSASPILKEDLHAKRLVAA